VRNKFGLKVIQIVVSKNWHYSDKWHIIDMFDVIKSTLAVETVFDFIYIISTTGIQKQFHIVKNSSGNDGSSCTIYYHDRDVSRIVLKTEYIIFKELVNNIIYVVRLSAINNHSWGLDSGHYGVGMADILWRCSKGS